MSASIRAQTATEYIVLIATVIIIALIVVGVLGGIPGIGNIAGKSTSQVSLATKELGVTDIAFGTIGVQLTIKNNGNSPIQLTAASLTESQASFAKDLPARLAQGESIRLESFSHSSFTANTEVQDYLNITWTDLQTNAVYDNNPDEYLISGVVSKQSVLRKSTSLVFSSSLTHTGNFGGVTGADDWCTSLANNASIASYPNSKQWVAWLSQSGSNATTRLTNIQVPIVLLNGSYAAFNRTDLITVKGTAYLNNSIRVDEYGAVQSGVAWTGTSVAGVSSGANCNSWTDGTMGNSASGGTTTVRNNQWTANGNIYFCDELHRLYCFEKY